MNKRIGFLIVVLLLTFSSTAHAEVMDKEPSLLQNLTLGILGSALSFMAARFKPWLLLPIVPATLFYFIFLIGEIRDPYVGPAILNEAGELYIYSVYFLGAIVIGSIVCGLILRTQKTQRNKLFQRKG